LLVSGQDQFLFYHVTKSVQWVHEGKKEPAKRGAFLKSNQSIVLQELSDIMLVKNDGKSMLLNKPGTYTFQQIKTLFLKSKTTSASAVFFAYVFEKFLSGDDAEEKQKVSAVVFRGPKAMRSPADSVFIFSAPVLYWKPEQVNIPYKIELKINGTHFDTIVRKQNSLVIPQRFLNNIGKQPVRIEWVCYPADGKQKAAPFLMLIPKKADESIIQQQLLELKKLYKANSGLYKVFEKDLLEKWLDLYQLK
jgi:hypothetical protein